MIFSVLFLTGITANAQTLSGSFRNSFRWELDTETGVLTISGDGMITDNGGNFSYPWNDYKDSIKSVIVENGVQNIPYHAFSSCVNLTSVSLPNSMEIIGNTVFRDCTSLESIVIPDSVTHLGEYAFTGCSALSDITLSKNLKTIDRWCFSDCNSLVNITLPQGLETINGDAFNRCTALESIIIPDTVTTLETLAFNACSNLKSVKLSDNLSTMGKAAFQDCVALEEVIFPKNMKSTGESAFIRCYALKEINLPESLESIDYYAFSNCDALTSVTVPEGVTTIGEQAFSYCDNLNTISFPDTLESIGLRAFWYTKVQNVVIPQSVKTIKQYAFSDCLGTIKFYSDSCEINPNSSTINNRATMIIPCGESTAKSYAETYKRVPEIFHFEETVPEVPATCTTEGLTEGLICPRCGEILVEQNTVDLKPHTLTTETTSATCTENGKIETKCTVCETVTASKTLFAPGHKEVVTKPTKAPAYQVNGNTEEISCSACNTILKASEVIPALNYKWTYDNNCHLYISGEGAINPSDSYEWERYNNEIMYVEIEEGITSVSENCFDNTPYLTEIYLSSSVNTIETNSISNCPLLGFVTFNSDVTIQNGAFSACNKELTFVLTKDLPKVEKFAKDNSIKVVKVNYDSNKNTLNFVGDITIEDYTEFAFLNNILKDYTNSEYIYFSELIFKDYNFWFDDDYIDAEITDNDLILHNVYVNLILVSDSEEKNVTFGQMVELLENGDYDAFKYHLESDEKEEEGNLFTRIFQRALAFFSKIINFFTKLFKK